jgi:anti-sigma regulatory factor (Ser/Thr protein kinase)
VGCCARKLFEPGGDLVFAKRKKRYWDVISNAPDPLLLLVVPARPEVVPDVRREVRAHLQRFGIEAAGAVELAVAEAFENAVVHGYRDVAPGDVEVVVVVADEAVEVVVRDDGVGPVPHLEHSGAGYGLVLIEALADRFELDGEVGVGTTLRMEFSPNAGA